MDLEHRTSMKQEFQEGDKVRQLQTCASTPGGHIGILEFREGNKLVLPYQDTYCHHPEYWEVLERKKDEEFGTEY